ncbi:hypothetical protein [Tritonibacter mobilis]|jgi:hypothetical protein|uniref:Integrase catalytic domain-containing protein n=1 Tax=Phaeobacter inhibens TaxID=221822 RepID=A0A2I7KGP0_9RHOB|nr:hypothetical protein PhaeoP88_04434 [Phaeobacter inhibens]
MGVPRLPPEAVPYCIHTIPTDNGIQLAKQPRNQNTDYSPQMRFDMNCEAHGIGHRLTKPDHPWISGQIDRMKRTIKDVPLNAFTTNVTISFAATLPTS